MLAIIIAIIIIIATTIIIITIIQPINVPLLGMLVPQIELETLLVSNYPSL